MEQATYTPARAPSSARFPKRRAAIMHVLQFCRKTNRAAPKFFLDAARSVYFPANFLRLGQKPNPGIFARPVQRGPAWQHSHACARVMGVRWHGAAHHPQKMPMARVRQMPCPLPQCRWHPPQYRPRAMAPQWNTAYRQKPEQALRCWALPGLRQVRSAGPMQGPTQEPGLGPKPRQEPQGCCQAEEWRCPG